MSKDEKYTSIEIETEQMTEGQRLAIAVIMNEGMLRERERIIGLLEDLDRHGTTHSEFCAARHAYAAQAIALINGEENA